MIASRSSNGEAGIRPDRPEHGLDELLRTDQELMVGEVRASFGGLGSG